MHDVHAMLSILEVYTFTTMSLEIHYFATRGGSRKKIAKKIIPRVPTSKNV
jgi:hypothetical protein